MKIRKASLKDVALIVRINDLAEDSIDTLFDSDDEWTQRHFKDILKNKKAEVFIYENKGVVAFKKDFPGYKNCELYWLTVDKTHHRKGIGKKLVIFIEKKAKKLGFKSLYLYTHPIHKPAIKFYKKLGFKKVNEFPNYYSNGNKSILMSKQLK